MNHHCQSGIYCFFILVIVLVLGKPFSITSQTLPSDRSVDWTLAGLEDTSTIDFVEIDISATGLIGDGITPNDQILSDLITSNTGAGLIINIPSGDFLFNEPILLPSNTLLRGQGAQSTILRMNLGGSGHAIDLRGTSNNQDTTVLRLSANKTSDKLIVWNAKIFKPGEWAQLIQEDTDLVTSSWAENTVGQIIRIAEVNGDTITSLSPLRMDMDTSRKVVLQKVKPIANSGIECLKILRLDDTAPQQSSNIYFRYAANCWVSGIESENCVFSHIDIRYSSNLLINKSYFHHAFDYGGGGRGYGVTIQFTSNECRVEDNIFEHLRHSMILQAGANGNVFAYNYSHDPFWSSFPTNAAGDMVLHGNYVYANLFEQNVCQNIVVDNSHGPNGPINTFFRNRAEGFGIFFSADNSPGQNFIGNEIPNLDFPYSLVNYTIQGVDHFLHGNNNKGMLHPPGTDILPDSSYAYTMRPPYIPINQWAKIGTPFPMASAGVPAEDRYKSGFIFENSCKNSTSPLSPEFSKESSCRLFPNPCSSFVRLESRKEMSRISITNLNGQILYQSKPTERHTQLDVDFLPPGIYILTVQYSDRRIEHIKMMKL